MQYSTTTKGFYPDDTSAYPELPDDLIAITDAEYTQVLAIVNSGGSLAVVDGKLVATPHPAPTTAEIKAAAWVGIMAVRDRLMAAGGYEVSGKWYHSDGPSRVQQLGLVLLGSNIPEGLMWKTMDGSFVAMTPTLAGQILGAAAASDYAIFTAAEIHRAAIEAAQDPAAYDYSGGWPAVYTP